MDSKGKYAQGVHRFMGAFAVETAAIPRKRGIKKSRTFVRDFYDIKAWFEKMRLAAATNHFGPGQAQRFEGSGEGRRAYFTYFFNF